MNISPEFESVSFKKRFIGRGQSWKVINHETRDSSFAQIPGSRVRLRLLLNRAEARVEEQRRGRKLLVEVEHIVKRARDLVIRTLPDPFAIQPIVFDEVDDRRLIGERVIDVIMLRIGRDHQQRARAVARTVDWLAIDARQRARGHRASRQRHAPIDRTAFAGRDEIIFRGGRRVDHIGCVIIPTVEVIVSDDHGRVAPELALLQRIENRDDERLLVERVGIAGMSVLIGRWLRKLTAGRLPAATALKKSCVSY